MKSTAGRFKTISIILILWNLLGVLSFIGHMGMTGEKLASLPEAEQALYTAFPAWVKVVFGIAVITGVAGAVALFLRKRISINLFAISFLAVIIQMGYNMFFTDSIAYYGTMSIVMPILVILVGLFSLWYARKELS